MSLNAQRFTRTNRTGLPYIGHHVVAMPRPLPAVLPPSEQVCALFLRRLPSLQLSWASRDGKVKRYTVQA